MANGDEELDEGGVDGVPDFEAPDFDADEWAANFDDAALIGEQIEALLDRPTSTTMEDGSSHTTVIFLGQELEALRALAQRLTMGS